jgi:hypothetical protein
MPFSSGVPMDRMLGPTPILPAMAASLFSVILLVLALFVLRPYRFRALVALQLIALTVRPGSYRAACQPVVGGRVEAADLFFNCVLSAARSTALPRRYTREIRRVLAMLSSGFASSTRKSAFLPGATMPN